MNSSSSTRAQKGKLVYCFFLFLQKCDLTGFLLGGLVISFSFFSLGFLNCYVSTWLDFCNKDKSQIAIFYSFLDAAGTIIVILGCSGFENSRGRKSKT